MLMTFYEAQGISVTGTNPIIVFNPTPFMTERMRES